METVFPCTRNLANGCSQYSNSIAPTTQRRLILFLVSVLNIPRKDADWLGWGQMPIPGPTEAREVESPGRHTATVFPRRVCGGEENIPLSFLVLLAGLIIQMTWDRLIGENNQVYYICTYRGSVRICDQRTNQTAEVYKPSWAKGKEELVGWDFKGQEDNSHENGKANVW